MKTWDAVYQEWQTDDGQIHAMRMGLLIRCKDCKHKNEYSYCTVYLNFHHLTADMDYCSDAERKES